MLVSPPCRCGVCGGGRWGWGGGGGRLTWQMLTSPQWRCGVCGGEGRGGRFTQQMLASPPWRCGVWGGRGGGTAALCLPFDLNPYPPNQAVMNCQAHGCVCVGALGFPMSPTPTTCCPPPLPPHTCMHSSLLWTAEILNGGCSKGGYQARYRSAHGGSGKHQSSPRVAGSYYGPLSTLNPPLPYHVHPKASPPLSCPP